MERYSSCGATLERGAEYLPWVRRRPRRARLLPSSRVMIGVSPHASRSLKNDALMAACGRTGTETEPGKNPPTGAVTAQVADRRLLRLESDGEIDPGDQLREITISERYVRGVAFIRRGLREPVETVDGRCGYVAHEHPGPGRGDGVRLHAPHDRLVEELEDLRPWDME